MPVSDQQRRALVYLAIACRPHGAPHWDEAGVSAAIAKVAQARLPDVAMAVIRAASDATATTPGVIAATDSIHWSERAKTTETYRPPKAHEACQLCGRWLESCICEAPTVRRPEASSNRDAILAQIRAESRERRRAMCAHGVPREHCTEHGGTRPETAVRATESAAEPFSGTPEGDSASASVSGAEIGAAS